MNYLTAIELLTFFSGLLAWKRTKPAYLRWVTVIIGITVFNESALIPYVEKTGLVNHNIVYNAFSLVDMSVWFYIFWCAGGRRYRRVVALTATVSLFYSVYELSVLRNWSYFHVDSFRLYELAIIVFSVRYLFGLLREEYHNLAGDLFFWCCAACILYHGILFLNFTTVAEHNYWKIKNAVQIFFILQDMASVFYYLLICIGFLIFFYRSRSSKTCFPGS
jgi:hypothetical protein